MELQIPFLLPYKLPVPADQKVVSEYVDFATFKITFDEYTRKITHTDNPLLNLLEDVNTIIWLNIYIDNTQDISAQEDKDEFLREFMFYGLEYVNKFLDSFRDTTRLDYIRNIHFLDLPKFAPILINGEEQAYVRYEELSMTEQKMSKNKFLRILKTLSTWDQHPEFGLINQFYSQANASIYQGNFPNAVIQLQTAFEVLVRTSLKMIITTEGLKKKERQSKIDKEIRRVEKMTSFRKIIEEELAKYLNVNLNFVTNKEIKYWKDNLYKLRNQIVHAGRRDITRAQITSARDSFLKVQEYLTKLLIQKAFLAPDGSIDLTQFGKSAKLTPEITDKLKEKGILPKDLPVTSL